MSPRVLADLSPLRRSRDLRLLPGGKSIPLIGTQITLVALPYRVFLIAGLVAIILWRPAIATWRVDALGRPVTAPRAG